MFKIGETPSLKADPVEHADFLELECLRQSDGDASGGDLAAALSRISDDAPEDRPDADTTIELVIDAAFNELTDRADHSGGGAYEYPFRVDADSKVLTFQETKGRHDLYLFLLLATRMNMKTERKQAEIDGTLLFEEICCEVGKNYWGERSEGMIFGTARRTATDEVGRFVDAVNAMCTNMGEGVAFLNHSGKPPTAKDGNLDIVLWKRFTDKRQGQLIGFGQCKTGTNFEQGTFELVPEGFCGKWVRTRPAEMPSRLFFMTARPYSHKWFDTCVDAGIVFDRCRILDFAPEMPTELKKRWIAWVKAALVSKGIKVP